MNAFTPCHLIKMQAQSAKATANAAEEDAAAANARGAAALKSAQETIIFPCFNKWWRPK